MMPAITTTATTTTIASNAPTRIPPSQVSPRSGSSLPSDDLWLQLARVVRGSDGLWFGAGLKSAPTRCVGAPMLVLADRILYGTFEETISRGATSGSEDDRCDGG